MNISQKYLQSNGISEEKKAFYENLPERYSKLSLECMKKNSHEHSNFSKKVMNWLFNQNEDTRMLLCSVENKKYTNTIFDAYSYLVRHEKGVKFLFSEVLITFAAAKRKQYNLKIWLQLQTRPPRRFRRTRRLWLKSREIPSSAPSQPPGPCPRNAPKCILWRRH